MSNSNSRYLSNYGNWLQILNLKPNKIDLKHPMLFENKKKIEVSVAKIKSQPNNEIKKKSTDILV